MGLWEHESIKKLRKYEEQECSLQCIAGVNLKTIIDIAKSQTLYIEIGGTKISLSTISNMMQLTGWSYDELYRKCLYKPASAEECGEALRKVINEFKKSK